MKIILVSCFVVICLALSGFCFWASRPLVKNNIESITEEFSAGPLQNIGWSNFRVVTHIQTGKRFIFVEQGGAVFLEPIPSELKTDPHVSDAKSGPAPFVKLR